MSNLLNEIKKAETEMKRLYEDLKNKTESIKKQRYMLMIELEKEEKVTDEKITALETRILDLESEWFIQEEGKRNPELRGWITAAEKGSVKVIKNGDDIFCEKYLYIICKDGKMVYCGCFNNTNRIIIKIGFRIEDDKKVIVTWGGKVWRTHFIE